MASNNSMSLLRESLLSQQHEDQIVIPWTTDLTFADVVFISSRYRNSESIIFSDEFKQQFSIGSWCYKYTCPKLDDTKLGYIYKDKFWILIDITLPNIDLLALLITLIGRCEYNDKDIIEIESRETIKGKIREHKISKKVLAEWWDFLKEHNLTDTYIGDIIKKLGYKPKRYREFQPEYERYYLQNINVKSARNV